MDTCIPMQDEYVNLLGKAVYSFAYYEGTIVDILSYLDVNFRQRYYREWALTAGNLKNKFKEILNNQQKYILELNQCLNDFSDLIDKRNRLIHSHPITDKEDGQILNYQADVKKSIHDFKWKKDEVIEFIKEINDRERVASELLEKLRC